MSAEIEAKVRKIIETVLGDDVDADSAAFGAPASWDALAQLEIMMAIEDELGIMFDRDESEGLKSFSAIVEKLKHELK